MVALEHEPPPRTPAPSADAIPLALRRRGGAPRQVLALTLIGTLALALFASHDLATWLDRTGDGPMLEPLQQAARRWDGMMESIGFTAPAEALRDTMHRLLDLQWGEPP